MDFVSDSLADGRSFRALAIVDQYTRACPVVEIDLSLPGARVLQVLEQLAEERVLPDALRVDHGPELVCDAVRRWCAQRTWNSNISNLESLCRMGTSNHLTASCAMNV